MAPNEHLPVDIVAQRLSSSEEVLADEVLRAEGHDSTLAKEGG